MTNFPLRRGSAKKKRKKKRKRKNSHSFTIPRDSLQLGANYRIDPRLFDRGEFIRGVIFFTFPLFSLPFFFFHNARLAYSREFASREDSAVEVSRNKVQLANYIVNYRRHEMRARCTLVAWFLSLADRYRISDSLGDGGIANF